MLICGHEARVYEIKRDEFIINQLIKQQRRFWEYVQKDVPPPADGSESAAKALSQLYPTSQGEMIDYRDNDILNSWFNQLSEQKKLIDQHQHRFDFLKQQIQQVMKTAELATFANGSVSWKKSKDSISLDTKALLKDQPELLNQYPQVRQGSRRFLVNTKT